MEQCTADEAPSEEEEPLDEGDVLHVGSLIEELNEAIDNVNVLEDEHQTLCATHAAAQAALQCQVAVLEAEAPPWRAQVAAAVDASVAATRAKTSVVSAEAAVVRLKAEQSQLQVQLSGPTAADRSPSRPARSTRWGCGRRTPPSRRSTSDLTRAPAEARGARPDGRSSCLCKNISKNGRDDVKRFFVSARGVRAGHLHRDGRAPGATPSSELTVQTRPAASLQPERVVLQDAPEDLERGVVLLVRVGRHR